MISRPYFRGLDLIILFRSLIYQSCLVIYNQRCNLKKVEVRLHIKIDASVYYTSDDKTTRTPKVCEVSMQEKGQQMQKQTETKYQAVCTELKQRTEGLIKQYNEIGQMIDSAGEILHRFGQKFQAELSNIRNSLHEINSQAQDMHKQVKNTRNLLIGGFQSLELQFQNIRQDIQDQGYLHAIDNSFNDKNLKMLDENFKMLEQQNKQGLKVIMDKIEQILSQPLFQEARAKFKGSKHNTEKVRKTHPRQLQIFPQRDATIASGVSSMLIHPSYQYVFVGCQDSQIRIWNVDKFKQTSILSRHKKRVTCMSFNPYREIMSSGSQDKVVLLWDQRLQLPVKEILGHNGKVFSTKFDQTGDLLATCGEQGQLFVWDIRKIDKPYASMTPNCKTVCDISWSGQSTPLFASTDQSQLYAFDSRSFDEVAFDYVGQDTGYLRCESVTANFKLIQNRIFCGTSRGVIACYEMEKGNLVKQTQWLAHEGSVRTLNYHPSRKVLLSTGRDGSAKLWDASSETEQPFILGNLALHQQSIPGAGFIGQEFVITGCLNQKLALWSIKDLFA